MISARIDACCSCATVARVCGRACARRGTAEHGTARRTVGHVDRAGSRFRQLGRVASTTSRSRSSNPRSSRTTKGWLASERAGNVVNRAQRTATCPVGNLPMMMASSPPLNIVSARDEILIGAESNRGRFIYTDGRPHPDVKAPAYVASGFGHSIGHWEGDTLVVDTIGFPRASATAGGL